MEKYQDEYHLEYQELDYKSHLKIESLMSKLSSIATTHASKIGLWNKEMEGTYGWVVSKMRLKIHQLISSEQHLIVKTWPTMKSKVVFPRYYTVEDENGNMLVEAVGLWTLLDLQKRRIVPPGRIGLELPEGLCQEQPVEIETNFLYDDISFTEVEKRRVRYSEVDVNQHLNNAKYMAYAMDVLDYDAFKSRYVSDVSIYFKKETEPNAILTIEKYEDETKFIVRGKIEDEIHFIVEGLWKEY